MKSYNFLPDDYVLSKRIDLKNNAKLSIVLNVLSIFLMISVIAIVVLISDNIDFKTYAVISAVVGMFIYIVLHELTHGLVLKCILPHEKLNFGITTSAAYCGMKKAYIAKSHYIVVALAPVVLWGIVFLILQIIFFNEPLFLTFSLFQMVNIGGATGDFYCSIFTLKCSHDVLVNDDGMSMRFYEIGEIKDKL